MKIWIVDNRTRNAVEVKQIDENRLQQHQYSPPGMARYLYRKLPSGEFKWSYVHYGNTREEAVAAFNAVYLREIEELQKSFDSKVAELKKRLAS